MSDGLVISGVAGTGGLSSSDALFSRTALTPLASPSAPTAKAATALPFPDPKMAIDPSLGISVLEYLSSSGAIVSSIPSQQQLQSYRQGLLAQGGAKGKNTLSAA
jgi:hypothetical protein